MYSQCELPTIKVNNNSDYPVKTITTRNITNQSCVHHPIDDFISRTQ